MELIQKQRLMRRYLQERSIDKHVQIDDVAIKDFDSLSIAIHLIEKQAGALFSEGINADYFENNPEKWQTFKDILDYSLTLSKGSPPDIQSFKTSLLKDRVTFWIRDLALQTLPGCDYYNRTITRVPDEALVALAAQSRAILDPLIASFLPGLDLSNNKDIQLKINALTSDLNKEEPGSPTYTQVQSRLNILMDLNKINLLQTLDIPQDDGSSLVYCTLAESAGGVTEKVSLISADEVKTKLNALNNLQISTIDEYSANRAAYKLSPRAILKLPKHGDIQEVQREAMALNISRVLGLQTTQSTMVNYGGKPALFVPFDEIHLLKELSSGKTIQALLFSLSKYTDYSTLNAVGEGLQSERFTEDLGRGLGLFYLCNDTDAIGGYNQNKAIKDNSLYIFDQVVKPSDNLELDSRLGMQAIGPLKYTRHGVGRNFTLFTDASIDTRFDALMQLKIEEATLSQYCGRVAFIHSKKIVELTADLEKTADPKTLGVLQDDIKCLKILEQDALNLEQKVHERIQKIDVILLNASPNISTEMLKKTRVLELLINKPRLFTDDARPYRHPWTDSNKNFISSINAMEARTGFYEIKFEKPIPIDVVMLLNREKKGGTPIVVNDKEMIIDENSLLKLHENILFPEHGNDLIGNLDYLNAIDLLALKAAYPTGQRGLIIKEMTDYCQDMGREGLDVKGKLDRMKLAEGRLMGIINTEKDKGFGMHVLKKFHFDVQQRLQKMMPEGSHSLQLNNAFNAALKLDQMTAFNAVVQEAVYMDKLTSPTFRMFLDACIDKVSRATDHFSAQILSKELAVLSNSTLIELDDAYDLLEDVQAVVVQSAEEALEAIHGNLAFIGDELSTDEVISPVNVRT